MKKRNQFSLEDFLVDNIESDNILETKLILVTKNELDYASLLQYIKSEGLETNIPKLIQLLYSSQLEIRDTSKNILIQLEASSVPYVYEEYCSNPKDSILGIILVEIGTPFSEYITQKIDPNSDQVDPALITILSQIGDSNATSFIISLVKNTDNLSDNLRSAVTRLGEKASPYLVEILYEEKRGKAKEIAKLVSAIGGEHAKKLVPLIHDTTFKPIWPEIIAALQKLEDPEVEEIIEEYNENINELYSNKWRKRAKETKEKTFR